VTSVEPGDGRHAAAADVRGAVDSVELWYHTIDLPGGVATPGWFDLRPIVSRMPWPDVAGKRCLDIGTYDGFLAFELERRGAAEVVATDISDHDQWDWPPDVRARAGADLGRYAGPEKGRGFRVARDALRSSVERIECSVYDLSPERVGRFDVVVCGTLLLHLRDPIRALEAMRSVCVGHVLSAEEVRLRASVLHPRRPVVELNGVGELCQWWVPNVAGHRRMLRSAGFAIDRATAPYSVPFGVGGPRLTRRHRVLGTPARRLLTGNDGVPHSAVLAHPSVS
jgi:tRNA (mo5U34)-methyltransferase